jgi:Predicted membrane protein
MRWHDGFHHGVGWGGLILLVMMVVLLAGVIWLLIVAARGGIGGARGGSSRAVPGPVAPSPEDILRERLARGEIDPDDYAKRLNALRSSAPPPSP